MTGQDSTLFLAKLNGERLWGAVIIILHLVGGTAAAFGFTHLILPLTPLHLAICAGIVMAFTGSESPWKWALTMFLGFGVEVIGVETGLLFGDYEYGSGLGPKVLKVPMLMGVLWWILLLGTHHWSARWLSFLKTKKMPILRAALAASLMTAMDVLIEPVAVRAGWWAWSAGDIPISNYLTWWIVAFALGLLWRDEEDLKTNRLSGLLVVAYALFIGLLNLLSWTL